MAKRTQGAPAGLSRGRIAAAAVALVDQVGLEAFGVRRLAADLGVDPMSIYNHIKGKDALLDAVTETVLAEATAAATRWPDDWRGVARAMAQGYRDMAARHPRAFPLLATRAQKSAVALDALERLTAAMRRAGVAEQTIADAPLILFGFLNGYLLAVLDTGPGPGPGDRTDTQPTATQPVMDPDLYPTIATLAPLQAGFGSEAEFHRMLETVLGGVAADDAGRRSTADGPERCAAGRRPTRPGSPTG